MKRIFTTISLLLAATFFMPVAGSAQCDCGDGSDGAFNATTSTTLAGGTYQYTTFNIDAGVTVTVTGNQPLVIHSTGNITINGTLNLNGGNGTDAVTYVQAGLGGIGVAGGFNGGDGVFSSSLGEVPGASGFGPGAGGLGTLWGGGGGASYGGLGTSGEFIGNGGGVPGAIYGEDLIITVQGGSGGGSGSGGYDCGSGGGGAGGGVLVMRSCDSLMVGASGVITANGGNGGSDGTGNCGGGGAGAGGTIWLIADDMVQMGTVSALGGAGGASNYNTIGGNGGAGRIRLDYNTYMGGTTAPLAGFTTSVFATTDTVTGPLCNGDATAIIDITASGGGGGYTYLWSNGDTTTTIDTLPAGTYYVTVTDTNGCTITDTVTVTEPVMLTTNMSSTPESTPSANDGTVGVNVYGGTGPYTYSWTPGGATTSTVTGLDSGTYIVIITDGNGCTITDTVHVGLTTSVVMNAAGAMISIYPNPAEGYVTVSTADVQGITTLQLMDITGRLLATEQYTGKQHTMNVSAYPAGNYLLRISNAGVTQSTPLTIKR